LLGALRVLSQNEVRTIVATILDKQFSKEQVVSMMELANNCTDNNTLPFTYEALDNCTKFKNRIEKHYKFRLANKLRKHELFLALLCFVYLEMRHFNRYELAETDDVAFVMVRTNASNVQHSIDGIRQQRQKFVCLNDNMNHSNPHSVEVRFYSYLCFFEFGG